LVEKDVERTNKILKDGKMQRSCWEDVQMKCGVRSMLASEHIS
jgi:hypothetical protein